MPVLPPRRTALCALALLVPLAASALEAQRGPVAEGLRLQGERGEERDGRSEAAPRCVLRSVFDPVDGVEHVGTGAWLEAALVADRSEEGAGEEPSAWGARLADWHHEASFWIVRDGLREGVVLASGTRRSALLPLEVSRLRHYRLTADETGARLAVDGRTVLALPLEPRRRSGEPAATLGLGSGALDGELSSVAHGCLRPVGARLVSNDEAGVTAALLGSAGFRPGLVVDEESLRAGDAPAAAGSVREEDVDGDGHLDLVADFPGARTPDGVLRVEARDGDGGRLQGWDLLTQERGRAFLARR